ncbi:MAG: hypothetical protein IPO88_03895 [Nannocystis sp.]|uniref:hypothetical protein n=1 Tax=Nannocystis sp. TaxID=1962667 RepID=UPI002422FE37|nr:hypothetical protein [Nannocystis sp.]MBK9752644.1 hypothetical protein [Nannocystis sp.]
MRHAPAGCRPRRLDAAFVSHCHADHLSSLDEPESGADGVPITTVVAAFVARIAERPAVHAALEAEGLLRARA